MPPETQPSPADRCPYRRPFPEGFDECGAYQPAPFVGLDTHNNPLPMVWSCRNLRAGEYPAGGHYARCALGGPTARLRGVTSESR